MRILLSNDDGYFAPGLACLADFLSKMAEIIVVAPERDRSGSSNSLTLDRPLNLQKSHNGFYYVNGTPTDCVHLAVTGMLDVMPDMIISGINQGANMGDDTIYSGTVAAATEGFLLGIPSIAVSLVNASRGNYLTAACVAADMVSHFRENEIKSPVLLNINVPDIEYHQLKGIEVTRLGRRHKAEPVIKSQSPRGEVMYWVGAAGPAQDAGKGTDFYATQNDRVSVTPLQIDLTRYDQLDLIARWLDNQAPGMLR
ncbi:5'-nucleotidase /3'-nucleotidase /exopolyphosphatase [Nitrosomonas ureae]|uniref:5'-nucleotidase SurE n=1 Tax=Nitrosomonas ureae TaxID=44577 RepID=A0A285BVU7_9PROT|nr:5'/3'-nucleotidase SurE [Nitrosomonas ureae]SNX59417.1 5'-nucleotidase /3'-nucleotidase /exopolyphosphatase [Nitrosomonas ureae]